MAVDYLRASKLVTVGYRKQTNCYEVFLCIYYHFIDTLDENCEKWYYIILKVYTNQSNR